MRAQGDNVSEVLGFLESIPSFSKISKSSMLALARVSTFQHVSKGEVLFLQSDQPELVYIVRSGEISIVLNSPDGREMVINEMHAGDLFGELGILTNKNRSTSAIARSKSELLVIPRRIFSRVIDSDPQFSLYMLYMNADRLQKSIERESALAFMDAQARLARTLLELDKQEKDKGYITISQDELANRTGLIRQTVAKALGKWRRDRLLITGRGRIMLLNRRAVEKLEDKSQI